MANKLIDSHSPYLIQHANDSIHWYPWSDEAFKRAKSDNKPIFLSIGYSSCHWCHVMAKESFSDDEIADILNKHYIAIKVDREERPDIDAVYMQFCHYMTGSGGWPLTIIMTPKKTPFFAATYLPKIRRFGRPGLLDILYEVKRLWLEDADSAISVADKIRESINHIETVQQEQKNLSDTNVFNQAFETLLNSFDEQYGGFGTSPKFPMPSALLFLMNYGWNYENTRALSLVAKTLDSMRYGGIYDHIGYGFHRYSVDRKWIVPHFEKMLIDQAYLLITYIEAYKLIKDSKYKEIVEEIIRYVFTTLRGPSGEFFTSEDADINGEEGAFYYWTTDELKKILSDDELDIVLDFFNISDEGNFIDLVSNTKNGRNILWTNTSLAQFAASKKTDITTFNDKMLAIRDKLYEYRKKRAHPNVDRKVLTDLNALMVVALTRAYRVFNEKKYLSAAIQAAEFILSNLYENTILYHSYYKGHKNVRGLLNDFSYLIWGLLELYQATFDSVYLTKAQMFTDQMISSFWDKENGGFYVTPKGTAMPLRQKEMYASSSPSGNAVAAKILLILGKITGKTFYYEVAESVLELYSPLIAKTPHAYPDMLLAQNISGSNPSDIVIIGDLDSPRTQTMLSELNRHYLPGSFIIHIPVEKGKAWYGFDSFIKQQTQIDDKPTAYVCTNYACNMPTTDIKTMISYLQKQKGEC